MLDTRSANGALGGPILSAGQTRTFALTGVCSVPAAARALSVNVTVTQPAAAGVFQLTPGDAPQVNSATLNFTAGRTLANNASLLLATDGVAGTVKVFNNSAGNSHLIIDVNGYYQ